MSGVKIYYPNLDKMKAGKKAAKEANKEEKAESSKNKQMHSLAVSKDASLLEDKDAAIHAVSSFILPADDAILWNMGTETTNEEWTSHMAAAMDAGVMLTRSFEERVKSLEFNASMATQQKELEEQLRKKVEVLRQALKWVEQLETELEIKSKEAESIALKDAEIAKLKDMVVNQCTNATLMTRYELFKEYKAGKHISWKVDEEIAEYKELTSDDEFGRCVQTVRWPQAFR